MCWVCLSITLEFIVNLCSKKARERKLYKLVEYNLTAFLSVTRSDLDWFLISHWQKGITETQVLWIPIALIFKIPCQVVWMFYSCLLPKRKDVKYRPVFWRKREMMGETDIEMKKLGIVVGWVCFCPPFCSSFPVWATFNLYKNKNNRTDIKLVGSDGGLKSRHSRQADHRSCLVNSQVARNRKLVLRYFLKHF